DSEWRKGGCFGKVVTSRASQAVLPQAEFRRQYRIKWWKMIGLRSLLLLLTTMFFIRIKGPEFAEPDGKECLRSDKVTLLSSPLRPSLFLRSHPLPILFLRKGQQAH